MTLSRLAGRSASGIRIGLASARVVFSSPCALRAKSRALERRTRPRPKFGRPARAGGTKTEALAKLGGPRGGRAGWHKRRRSGWAPAGASYARALAFGRNPTADSRQTRGVDCSFDAKGGGLARSLGPSGLSGREDRCGGNPARGRAARGGGGNWAPGTVCQAARLA